MNLPRVYWKEVVTAIDQTLETNAQAIADLEAQNAKLRGARKLIADESEACKDDDLEIDRETEKFVELRSMLTPAARRECQRFDSVALAAGFSLKNGRKF